MPANSSYTPEAKAVQQILHHNGRRADMVARCAAERLMRRPGRRGVVRGKVVRATISYTKAPCPLDHVNRVFEAQRPNQLWVSDFTYIATWQGWLYVAFFRVGSRGDSYDSALAETINGLYKAELIHRRGLWKTRKAANQQSTFV
jgi:transposase InsO family protein